MRKSIISAIVVGLSLAVVGCPPPADNSSSSTNNPTDGGDTAATGGEGTDGGDATDGGESQPADGGSTDAAPADDNADLSHVKVGQKYVYEMPNNMQSIWEVTEVGDNMVKYKTTMLMDMGEGPAPVGEPTEQEWTYTKPTGGTTGETTGEAPKTSREEIEVSGVKFDCLVVESEAGGMKSKSWASMSPGSDTVPTFPGAIKVMTDGNPTMTLVKIE